jgi:hypothetical protein
MPEKAYFGLNIIINIRGFYFHTNKKYTITLAGIQEELPREYPSFRAKERGHSR